MARNNEKQIAVERDFGDGRYNSESGMQKAAGLSVSGCKAAASRQRAYSTRCFRETTVRMCA